MYVPHMTQTFIFERKAQAWRGKTYLLEDGPDSDKRCL